MTVFSGVTMTKLNADTPTPEPGSVNGTVKVFNEEYVVLGTETTSDTIEIGKLPKGARFLYGVFQSDDAQGSAQVAFGITGTTGKYRAAAVIAVDTPQFFGLTQGAVLTAEETIFVTISVGNFDAAGLMRFKLFYTLI